MQTDMHYYGTYAMARAAGFDAAIARAIATSAEYVDDSDRLSVRTTDGHLIESEPTAHHPINRANLDPLDQRRTWVPFHFVPGNEGKTLEERLICRMDSEIARDVVEHNLQHARERYGVLLIGITAHVYADTFAHYGFSGVSSIENQIVTGSIEFEHQSESTADWLVAHAGRFFENYIKGPAVELACNLGHGAVATYPDQPYLNWRFTYERSGQSSGLRENPATFLLACEKLHEMFCEFNRRTDGVHYDRAAYRDFGSIRSAVEGILLFQGSEDERVTQWQTAATDGALYGGSGDLSIPPYDSSSFTNDLRYLSQYDFDRAQQTLVYLFLQAANLHREFVVGALLPKYGIYVGDV